jgi:hypothetical protein
MSDEPRRPKPKMFSDPNYDKYKRSKKHEDRVAGKLNGRRLPRSGGLPWTSGAGTMPGVRGASKTAGADLQARDFMIEHKRTVNESMSIKRDWLEKVREGANTKMMDPALAVTFERGGTRPPEDWILIPLDVFERLTRKVDEDD